MLTLNTTKNHCNCWLLFTHVDYCFPVDSSATFGCHWNGNVLQAGGISCVFLINSIIALTEVLPFSYTVNCVMLALMPGNRRWGCKQKTVAAWRWTGHSWHCCS